MQKFATLCTVTLAGAAALELEAQKGTFALRIDNFEYDVVSMPHGKGKQNNSNY